MIHRIVLQPTAFKALADLPDRRIQEQIRDRIDCLAHDPELQGKPLTGEFLGYRSLRAAGQRYRVLYRVERAARVVSVVAIGLRKEGDRRDVYALARRLLRLGLA